ncbi:unnamed protein product [Onchocerca flexuosa]|uniref:Glyco_18 domain-containing protein n=1 Tax=Onchocerca flexuosa TaxID=387005 RepID=A0A183HCA5_9BILA|nr:unnamed protein product [Onchocerca flexuosa]
MYFHLEGEDEFLPEDIPKGLCTHILYAVAKVDESTRSYDIRMNQNEILSRWNQNKTSERNDGNTDWPKEMYSFVTKMKESDPELKILLSFGGYNFGSTTFILCKFEDTKYFKAIAKSAEKRKNFIECAIALLRQNKFDGFDLDWQYPIGVAEEYAELVKEMKKAFVEEAKKFGSEQLLLTATVSAIKHTIDQSYNVGSLGINFDLLFLMSYDFHSSWEDNVDLHAKLCPTEGEPSGIDIFNTEFAANYWVSKGMPKQKIIIGIPTYGRGWTLRNPSETTIGAEGIGPSLPSTTNQAGGTAAYWEV